jgi:ABC-type microcin C transport system permease subunit YejE
MTMNFFSPLTKKRLLAFRRNRRGWWSFLLLSAVFLFCLCAELVCPCDPNAVVDPSTLEPYRKRSVVKSYDVAALRFNISEAGAVYDFEGPENAKMKVFEALKMGKALSAVFTDYAVRSTPRDGYTRIFMEPKESVAFSEKVLPLAPVSFPFHPCPGHPFGIDAGGRDVYSRVVHGMRIALLFGFLLAGSGLLFGVVIGALEGYFGGKTDILLQRFTEIWSALPFLYVMIFLGSTVGRSFSILLVSYAIFNWIAVSYYMRAEFLRLRSLPFVDAAKSLGFSNTRIIFSHILPNALTPLITLFPFLLMGAIGSLAALDFLGFGLPPMTPSCGELLNQAQQFRGAWYLVVFPASALFIVMLLAVLVGEGLRDAFDPRQHSRLA